MAIVKRSHIDVRGEVPVQFCGSRTEIEFFARKPCDYKSLILTISPDLPPAFGQDNPLWARSGLLEAWFQYIPEIDQLNSSVKFDLDLTNVNEPVSLNIGKWANGRVGPLEVFHRHFSVRAICGSTRRTDYSMFSEVL